MLSRFSLSQLMLAAGCLVIFDGLLVYAFVARPAFLGHRSETWDFRINELRLLDAAPSNQVLPTPSAADAHGQVL